MPTGQLTQELQGELCRLLAAHQVTMRQPRQQMLQLDAVPVGSGFSAARTNVLLRQCPSTDAWQVFVDEGLAYQGDDPGRRAVFQGAARRGWQPMALQRPLVGDINHAVVLTLDWLDSDIRRQVRGLPNEQQETTAVGSDAFGARSWSTTGDEPPIDERIGRQLDLAELDGIESEPTSAQLDGIANAAATVCRNLPPNCPLISGPAGSGKTTIARLAARELLRRDVVDRVVELRGSAVCSGAVFMADRDERLRHALDALVEAPKTLVILEQFDLAIAKSPAANSLLADGLDRGMKLIAVTRAEFQPKRLRTGAALERRLEPLFVRPMELEETARAVQQRLKAHDLSRSIEVSPEIVPLIVEFSDGRPGANPGAALGLLEAVVSRAAFTGQQFVGPDDVFHLKDGLPVV